MGNLVDLVDYTAPTIHAVSLELGARVQLLVTAGNCGVAYQV
jgi:hypothetical protein